MKIIGGPDDVRCLPRFLGKVCFSMWFQARKNLEDNIKRCGFSLTERHGMLICPCLSWESCFNINSRQEPG